MKYNLVVLLLSLLVTTSCFKEEMPNVECDIESLSFEDKTPFIGIFPESPIGKDFIVFFHPRLTEAQRIEAATHISPIFVLSPGATVHEDISLRTTFSRTYVTVSENGLWTKPYTLIMRELAPLATKMQFDRWFKVDKYEMPYNEIVFNGLPEQQKPWASGNAGFALTGQGTEAGKYPTYYADILGRGRVLQLVTRSTGAFGAMAKMPIAAGNLFLGRFNMAKAMQAPLEATEMGTPFLKKPITFRLVYYYKPQMIVKDGQGNLLETPYQDKFSAYAVLFEVSESTPFLNGANATTSPSIVAIAEILRAECIATPGSDFVEKTIPFEYRKVFDPVKAKEIEYAIAIVMSSSAEGNLFVGGIGSTLTVAETELICE